MPIRSITKTQLEDEIQNLKKQIRDVEKCEQHYQAAADIRDVYDSFVEVGFTEDQAWEIVKIIINNGIVPKHS